MMIYYDGQRVELAAIKQASAAAKGADYDRTVQELIALHEGGPAAVHLMHAWLHSLGLGLRDNRRPVTLAGVLQYAMQRLSGLYDADATRSWSGVRVGSPRHRRCEEALRGMGWDGVMRRLMSRSALCRQAYVRVYGIDALGRLSARVWTPDLVHVVPHPEVPDELSLAHVVALEVSDGLEVWLRDETEWRMVRTDAEGRALDDEAQPFAATEMVSPYGLPILAMYDEPTDHAYLTPSAERVSAIMTAAAEVNDSVALAALQAHQLLVLLTKEPDKVQGTKAPSGPGRMLTLHQDDDAKALPANQAIGQLGELSQRILQFFLFGESIPVQEIRPEGVPQTGAALRVLERGLEARRRAQIPLAQALEARAWRIVEAVHNTHAETWGAEPLPEGLEMSVVHASTSTPVDDGELLSNEAYAMALGASDAIRLIMRREGLSESEAVAQYQRVQARREQYPVPVQTTTDGRRPDEVATLNLARETADGEAVDSVVDAVRGRSAADAREDRREDEGAAL